MSTWSKSVFSSSVSEVAYDDETNEMTVTFKNGARYSYEGVDEAVAVDLANAPSVGSMLHNEIKGRYGYRRVG